MVLDPESLDRLDAAADALEDAWLQINAILTTSEPGRGRLPGVFEREVGTPQRAERQEDKAAKLQARHELRAREKREAAERMALEDHLEGSTDAPPSLNLGGDL